MMAKVNGINQMRMADLSPEKAGVGGSIPSLATIFNNLETALPRIGCIWLHLRNTSLPHKASLHYRGLCR